MPESFSFEMPADLLTLVVSNDGRFSGDQSREHAYSLWLGLLARPSSRSYRGDDPDAASWVAAGAAGCLGEAMAVLCLPADTRWRICAGYMGMPGWNMYYFIEDGQSHPVRPVDSAQHATTKAKAIEGRRIVEQKFFDQWMHGGGVACPKFWSIPFLEPVEPS